MDEQKDLIARLRALGSQPVSSEASRRHLAAIEAESDGMTRRSRAPRLAIVAAFVVGLLAGTSGLATAGALPGGAQEMAHRAFGAVGVDVPGGERYWGPECVGPRKKNHGAYVRSQPKHKRAEAAASGCGKPIKAVGGDKAPEAGEGGGSGACQGPPPWAGKGKPDKAAKEARKQACGRGQEAEDEDEKEEAKDEKEEAPGPSPMTSDTTTTTAATPTTVTTATTVPVTTETSATTSTTANTATTTTTTTTPPSAGGGGETVPSLPADPPTPGQGS